MMVFLVSLLIVVVLALAVVISQQASEIATLQRRLLAKRDQRPPHLVASNFDDVGAFHQKFELDNVTHRAAGPRALPRDAVNFRVYFLREELEEFIHATDAGDEAKAFDALLDLAYVTFGTAHLMGFPWQAGWDAVQRANMAKVRAAGAGDPRSTRGHALDVVKPNNWTPPDIAGVLFQHGWPPAEV